MPTPVDTISFSSCGCSPAYSVQVTSLGSDVSISGLEHSSSTGLLYGYAWSGAQEVFYSIDPSIDMITGRLSSVPEHALPPWTSQIASLSRARVSA